MTYKRYSRFAVCSIGLSVILALMPLVGYSYSTLSLDKTIFAPGEEIAVHFSVGDRAAQNAWIGIIPSHIAHGSEAENDKYDLTYQYLKDAPVWGNISSFLEITHPGQEKYVFFKRY